MLYVNQLDYPHVKYSTGVEMPEETEEQKARKNRMVNGTFAMAGCGLASAMMIVDRLFVGKEFSMKDALQLSYDTKANHHGGTDYHIYAPAFAEKFNLKLEMTRDPEMVRNCLRTGGVVVCHTGGDREGYVGVFTHGGHYFIAISEEADGRIVCLDPSYKEGKYEEEGRQGKVEVRDGVFAVTTMDVLVKDCDNRDPSFYCFWRNE